MHRAFPWERVGSGHKANVGIGSQKEFIGSPAPREEEHVTFIYACSAGRVIESCQNRVSGFTLKPTTIRGGESCKGATVSWLRTMKRCNEQYHTVFAR